ncbi:MAG: hypothetical protein ACKO0W_04120 [Planctomycetota bacterium]
MTFGLIREAAVATAAGILVPLFALAGCGEDRNYNAGIPGGGAAEVPEQVASAAASGAAEPAAPKASANTSSKNASKNAPSGAGTGSGASQTAGEKVDGGAAARETASSAPRVPPPPSKPADAPAPTFTSEGSIELPPAPALEIAPGEEPYQKLALDPKFAGFRKMSARYVQLTASLRPYAEKLADGSATDEDRRRFYRIEAEAEKEWRPINSYMWDERWTEADRAAMGWILYGNMQPKR